MSTTAAKHELTIMFIDVAGFSVAAETHQPDDVFKSLRDYILAMRSAVRKHGGTVDKTLGDGLLCYFGYDRDKKIAVKDHADRAVRCAISLQEMALQSCLAAGGKKPVYPIRIGLNTASVILGDLGEDGAPEYTIVGDGVNFAKRIEDSCDIFMITMSESTRAALPMTPKIESILKRGIMIKHHERLFDVFELNPFIDRAHDLGEGRKAYQNYRGQFRSKPRLVFAKDAPFDVQCDFGDCSIIDISLGGFQVALKRYLARGVHVKIAISGHKKDRKAQYLSLIGLTTLNCVVKWGRPSADGATFMHGLQILNLNSEQQEIIFSMLAKYSTPSDV